MKKKTSTTRKTKALNKPIVKRRGIAVSWEERKFKLTDEYVTAVKNLLLAELRMMREVYSETAEHWQIAVAQVNDMAKANYLEVMFGAKEDKRWLKRQGQIFVELP